MQEILLNFLEKLMKKKNYFLEKVKKFMKTLPVNIATISWMTKN